MTDNTPTYDLDLPDWAWEIIDKHDLGIRADSPLSAVTVLMTDAAEDLKALSLTAFRERAITTESRQQASDCAEMRHDALRLAPRTPPACSLRSALLIKTTATTRVSAASVDWPESYSATN